MDKPLLIVGIDPGTTCAYALLEVTGKVIITNSFRNVSRHELIMSITKYGQPLVIGSDKAKLPEAVKEIATSFGAEIVTPINDLTIEQKNLLVTCSVENDHERDALAAAIHAYNKYAQLLEKIRQFAVRNDKKHLLNNVYVLVVKDKLSIVDAVRLLERPEPRKKKIIHEIIRENSEDKKDLLFLYKEMRQLQNANELLKNSLKNKEREIQKMQSEEARHSISVEERVRDLVKNKEKTISALTIALKKKEAITLHLERENAWLRELIFDKDIYVVAKKMSTLGRKEFSTRKRTVKIRRGDILYVDDPTIVSDVVVRELSKCVEVLLHSRALSAASKRRLPFTCLLVPTSAVRWYDDFVVVEKSVYEKLCKEHRSLHEIVEEYQRERKKSV